MTLYTQVAQNRTKTIFYLVVYALLTLAVGYLVSWYFNSPSILFIFGIITVIQGLVSYWQSDKIALAVSRAVPLDSTRYAPVYRVVENLTIAAGLPMPRLYLINDSAMNAFATGRDAKHAAVAMTSGLLEGLNQNELEGVLAHELSHIGNEDIRLMSMVMVMAGLIALVSDFFLRSLWWGGGSRRRSEDGDNSGILLIIAIALAVLAPIAATLIQLAISRRREYLADATGVLITRYPEGLISALKKIASDKEPLEVANRATAHMYFSNPLKGQALANLFSTHPPITDRIAALERASGMST